MLKKSVKGKKSGIGKLILGLGAGIGLGMLLAPDKGSETRKKLKKSLDDLLEKVKEIDTDEVKAEIEAKVVELKSDVKDLDKEKILSLAKEKSEALVVKAEELVKYAKKKATPALEKLVEDVREKTIAVGKEVIEKLEKKEKKETDEK